MLCVEFIAIAGGEMAMEKLCIGASILNLFHYSVCVCGDGADDGEGTDYLA